MNNSKNKNTPVAFHSITTGSSLRTPPSPRRRRRRRRQGQSSCRCKPPGQRSGGPEDFFNFFIQIACGKVCYMLNILNQIIIPLGVPAAARRRRRSRSWTRATENRI